MIGYLRIHNHQTADSLSQIWCSKGSLANMVWAISLPQEWPINVDRLGLFPVPKFKWPERRQSTLEDYCLDNYCVQCFWKCHFNGAWPAGKTRMVSGSLVSGVEGETWQSSLFLVLKRRFVDITRWSQTICSLDLGFLVEILDLQLLCEVFLDVKKQLFIYIDLFIHPKMVERISTLELWKSEGSSQIFSMLSRTIEFAIW